MPEISTNHTFQHPDPTLLPSQQTLPPRPIPPAPPPTPPDLRRRGGRHQAELIARRACFLPYEQRALVIAVYTHGQSFSQLAALSGVSVRKLRRDVRRILSRLASPEFLFVAIHLEEWPLTMRRVAQTCILAGVPVRTAARTLRLTLYTVRKHRDTVRHLAHGAHADSDHAPRSKAG